MTLFVALLFLAMGAYTIWKEEGEVPLSNRWWGGAMTAFSLIALMELGDKSQLAVIALSAESGAPLATFIGAASALVLLTALNVVLAWQLRKRVSTGYLRLGSGLVFLAFGALFLVQLLLQ
ncbi:MAG: TMEM165/GDT1 family protein [Methanomassiliicoccales archaeon]